MSIDNIYIFNPENDLALAFGRENYTPPPLATRLRNDLSLLPIWYAPQGSATGIRNECDMEWVCNVAKNIDINTNIIELNPSTDKFRRFSPWGWSADTRKRLLDIGYTPDSMPSPSIIERIRQISHRRTSITIHKRLNELHGKQFAPIPVEISTLDDIKSFANAHPGCFIKAPWSSSGKGIFRVLDINAKDYEQWSSGILKRQGSVVCEQRLSPIIDFAMEFKHDKDGTKFVGYSVFSNDNHCSFDTGIMGSTPYLESLITGCHFPHPETLHSIATSLETIMDEIIGDAYYGYFGIDMMLYRDKTNKKVKINPCIELNLRMTMGMVTNIISSKYLAPGTTGKFRIEYFKTGAELRQKADNLLLEQPPIYNCRKIVSGTQILAPITSDTRYLAYMQVRNEF